MGCFAVSVQPDIDCTVGAGASSAAAIPAQPFPGSDSSATRRPDLALVAGDLSGSADPAATKRFRPPRPVEAVIQRTALVDRLTAGSRRAVVVSAPAGYGKSTLLAQWAERDVRPFVWLTLSASDNDARRLRRRLTAAIATLRFAGVDLPRLKALDRDGRAERLELDDLAEQLGAPCVVVLDDAHVVRSQSAVAVVEVLLCHLPAGSQVAIGSRQDAPLGVRGWRVHHPTLEIDWSQLSFTPAETRAAVGSRRRTVNVSVMHGWCEGWPAALSVALAADTWHETSTTGAAPAALDETFAQYVESELLTGLSEAELTFLSRSSVLDQLSDGACEAVAGAPDGVRLAALLWHHSLPVAVADADGNHRYHPLLRQSLRGVLVRREPQLVAELHVRAARWFASTGDIDAAFRHAVLADDLTCLGELLWQRVHPTLHGDELDDLRRDLNTLSADRIGRSLPLIVASAWVALLAGDAPTAARLLTLGVAKESDDWHGHLADAEHRGPLALLLAWQSRHGLAEALRLSTAAFEGLPGDSRWRPAAGALSGMALAALGQVAPALDRLRYSADLADALGDGATRTDCLSVIASLSTDLEGFDNRGDVPTWQALAADTCSAGRPTALYTASLLARDLARVGDPAAVAVLHQARQATELLAGFAPWLRSLAHVEQANTCLMLGSVPEARRIIRDTRRLLSRQPVETSSEDNVSRTETLLLALAADTGAGLSPFTAAERRILHLLPTYLSFVEMAVLLSVSRHTVKTQALAVYRKLGASSRAQAVERASAFGFFDAVAVPEWTAV